MNPDGKALFAFLKSILLYRNISKVVATIIGVLWLSTFALPAADGVPLWITRYNGSGNYEDKARALAVDPAGNVIVAGQSYGAGNTEDFATVKYSSSGTALWTNRFDRGFADIVTAIAVDSTGKVFVTGYSSASSDFSTEDYTTVAYSSAGVPLWTNFFHNTSSDYARAIAVDGSGNVFVTGESYNNSFIADYVTIAYSSGGIPLWTNRFNGANGYHDFATAIGTDSSGNVYVTGRSNGRNDIVGGTGLDYATIKYSNSGIPVWTNTYNGPEYYDDRATGLVIDGSGNVVVTGYSQTDGVDSTLIDFVTVKYSGAGVPMWTNSYNGPNNKTDKAAAVTVDSKGNVFVTGESFINNTSSDYATVAYSATGVQLWANRYNGTGSNTDIPLGVSADANGNVIVTGRSWGSNSRNAYATIAYSGAGVPLWTNRYNGPGFGDAASAIVVNNSGIFVTGASQDALGYDDYATIKFPAIASTATNFAPTNITLSSNQVLENQPGGTTVGTLGAIDVDVNDTATFTLVSGSGSADNASFSIVGNTLRTAVTFNFEARAEYSIRIRATDGGGLFFEKSFVIVTMDANEAPSDISLSPATVRSHQPAGTPIGMLSATDVDAGSSHTFALVAGSGSDHNAHFTLVGSQLRTATVLDPQIQSRYSVRVRATDAGSLSVEKAFTVTVRDALAGTTILTNRYDSTNGGQNAALSIAVDPTGRVFVTGFGAGAGGSDYATVAYSSDGSVWWTNTYNGPAGGGDEARAVALGNNGNVYVTGRSLGTGSNYDYATIAYTAAGVPLWTNRYNGPGNSVDDARAIAVDASGNVYVTGFSYGLSSTVDFATVAYSGSGVALWTNRYNGPGNGEDYGRGLALDTNGNVFVFGESTEDSLDFTTIKYSSGGAGLWTNRFSWGPNRVDQPFAIAVDRTGNAIVTGWSGHDLTDHDFATIAYSPSGGILWTNLYNGSANLGDFGFGVATDSKGDVFVTGSATGSNGFGKYDYLTIKYSAAGIPVWTNLYDGTGSDADQPYSMATDALGNVFITGSSHNGSGDRDYVTLAYSGDGAPLWTNRYNGPGLDTDVAHDLAVDPSGNVYVTGESHGSDFDFATLKYSTLVPSPRLLQPSRVGGVYQFYFEAEPELTYRVEATDLLNPTGWSILTHIAASPTVTNVIVQNPITNSARFYRVRTP